jgi:hypothetical protein
VPSRGDSAPAIARNVVDFPAPLAPNQRDDLAAVEAQ